MTIKLISTSTDWGNKLPEEYGNLQKTDFSYQLKDYCNRINEPISVIATKAIKKYIDAG